MRRIALLLSAVSAGIIVLLCPIVFTDSYRAEYEKTNEIIKCVECGFDGYLKANDTFPSTVEEALVAATSGKYCQLYCSDVVADSILGRKDGWGRPLIFEDKTLQNGVIEITIISTGHDGQRDSRSPDSERNDLHGKIYLATKKKVSGTEEQTKVSGTKK